MYGFSPYDPTSKGDRADLCLVEVLHPEGCSKACSRNASQRKSDVCGTCSFSLGEIRKRWFPTIPSEEVMICMSVLPLDDTLTHGGNRTLRLLITTSDGSRQRDGYALNFQVFFFNIPKPFTVGFCFSICIHKRFRITAL